MKKSILLLLLLALSASLGVQAQNTLNVYQKDGTIVCFPFSSNPVTRFVDADVVITTTDQTVSYPFASIEKYTFDDGVTPTGLISIRGTERLDAPISVYNAGGQLVRSVTPTDGNADLDLRSLPAGTYIIKNGTVTYKIQKK